MAKRVLLVIDMTNDFIDEKAHLFALHRMKTIYGAAVS